MRKTLSIVLSFCFVISLFACISGMSTLATVNSSSFKKGDVIEYGSYPQTRVIDNELKTKLDKKLTEWISYGKYKNGQPSDFMKYQDVEFDGSKYRAVTFSESLPNNSQGTNESSQLDNGYLPNNIYWFKYEPIKWRILDPVNGYVLCDKIIDSMYFHHVTDGYSNCYNNSDIREWITTEFYNLAFSEEEKAKIKYTSIKSNDYSSTGGSENTTNVSDKIFLPSYSEITNTVYGFTSTVFADSSRIAGWTDYTRCMGHDSNNIYRLRSAGYSEIYTCFVNNSGEIHDYNYVININSGIRPAMRLNFIENEKGTCGDNVTWNYNTYTDTLTISGTGSMRWFSHTSYNGNTVTDAPWGKYYNTMKAVVINSGLTRIEQSAFYGCTGLTSVTIPDSVTSISYEAFDGCTGLTSITIPDSVTSMSWGAFSGCTGLTSVTLPNSISIGDYAFSGCTSLSSITIPDGVTSIGWNAFRNTAWYNNQPDGLVYAGKVAYKYKGTSPATVTIKDATKGIAGGAFLNCTGLTSITIPGSVTSIGESAFYGCTSLTSITIPDSVRWIGRETFYNCASLTSITIPDSVTSIREEAFYGCTGLTSAFYTGTIEDWNSISIGSYNSQLTNNVIFVEGCGSNSYAGVNDNVLYIIGSGATDNYKMQSSVPWYSQKDYITEIQIDSTITNIGTYSFNCLDKLETIRCENKDLVFGKYAINTANKNIKVYGIGGGTLEQYCKDNGIEFIKPTPQTAQKPTIKTYNGNSIEISTTDGVEYSLDAVNWQDSGIFTGLNPVTEYNIYARIKETDEMAAGETSEPLTVKTTKLDCDKTPVIAIDTITNNKITLSTETGAEYSLDKENWNTTGVFTGLNPGAKYNIYARFAETDTVFVGSITEPVEVTTLKNTISAPAAPDYEAHTENSITLKPNSKYEFSMDGENWQKSNIFTNLSKNTIYRFYQRVAETDTEYASSSSPALITAIPDKPQMVKTTTETIKVREIPGFEYCLDDFAWQGSNAFDMLIEDMEYYVYQRIAAIPGEKVYQITSDYTTVITENKTYYESGDTDGDEEVTDKDATYLLFHLFFPEEYEVNQPIDFNGDKNVDVKDVIHLLFYIYFPKYYKLH